MLYFALITLLIAKNAPTSDHHITSISVKKFLIMFAMQYGHILRINCSVVVILSVFAKIHYKLTLSLYDAPATCFLRENVGGSEKNRLITGANVRTGDLLPSRMRVAVLSTDQRLRRRRTAGCWPMCQRGASSSRLCHGPASCTDAAASGPKCGNRLGLCPGCFL